jgi:hypothetical protein
VFTALSWGKNPMIHNGVLNDQDANVGHLKKPIPACPGASEVSAAGHPQHSAANRS